MYLQRHAGRFIIHDAHLQTSQGASRRGITPHCIIYFALKDRRADFDPILACLHVRRSRHVEIHSPLPFSTPVFQMTWPQAMEKAADGTSKASSGLSWDLQRLLRRFTLAMVTWTP